MLNALVLIVEDEPGIAQILDAYFIRDGFRTSHAADGETALAHHLRLAPDIVLLDWRLPKKDGAAVLATIRQRGDTPVIMATALGDDAEKLAALSIGADDYVVKPFNPLEVVARARAVLRRSEGGAARENLRVGAIELDLAGYVARLHFGHGCSALDLTLTEFRILAHLARAPGRAFTRTEIIDACLPPDGDALERTVDSHVSKLRKKLDAAGGVDLIEGVRGVGYKLLERR